MEVLFLKPFKGILAGETRKVKDGYAKNFLIKEGIALPLNHPLAQQKLREFAKKKVEQQIEQEALLNSLKSHNGKVLIITAKMTKKGKLYGSISRGEVAKLLGIPEEYLELPAITERGEYEVYLRFKGEKVAKIKLVVEEEKNSK